MCYHRSGRRYVSATTLDLTNAYGKVLWTELLVWRRQWCLKIVRGGIEELSGHSMSAKLELGMSDVLVSDASLSWYHDLIHFAPAFKFKLPDPCMKKLYKPRCSKHGCCRWVHTPVDDMHLSDSSLKLYIWSNNKGCMFACYVAKGGRCCYDYVILSGSSVLCHAQMGNDCLCL